MIQGPTDENWASSFQTKTTVTSSKDTQESITWKSRHNMNLAAFSGLCSLWF